MSFFEQKLAGLMIRKVASKLVDLQYDAPNFYRAKQVYGLKELISFGIPDFRILNDNRFSVEISAAQFSQALWKDYSTGAERIRQLDATADHLIPSKTCKAWLVVTAYYSAFFNAVEILRASGDYVSYFSRDVISVVTQSAMINGGVLESGSYQGKAKLDMVSGNVIITYAKSNVRHHQFAWKEIATIFEGCYRPADRSERSRVELIRNLLGKNASSGSRWSSPSDTRNHWNYEDASLFSCVGDRDAAQFLKILKTPGAGISWVANNPTRVDLVSQTSAIGFAREFLGIVAKGVGERMAPVSPN